MMSNKAVKFIKMIEDLIDPQSPYPTGPLSNAGINPREREWTNNTHHKLVKEAMRHTDQSDESNPDADALKSYTGAGYSIMNDHLRHNIPIGDHHKLLLGALKHLTQTKTEHTFTSYRGSKEKLFDHSPGTVFQDKGFTSTTLRPSIAHRFASKYANGQTVPEGAEKYIYRVHVNPGTRGYYVSGHKAVGSDAEREFVLHPGTKFKVGDTHHHTDGNIYTDLHIHSQDD